MKNTGIFVPIRLQSERLPNKMMLPLGDTNLVEIACRKLKNICNNYNIDCYILSSKEDIEVIDIAKKYGLNIIYRDNNTCTVDGPLSYIFKDLKHVDNSHLMFLNGCIYNISETTIVNAIKLFNESNSDYATSVKRLQNWIFDDCGNSINEIDYLKLNTKTIKPIYQAAHCFHIFNKGMFFENGKMLDSNMMCIEVSDDEVLDIDTYNDYMYARFFLTHIGDDNID